MQSIKDIQIHKITSKGRRLYEDQLAIEEPLEIQLSYGNPIQKKSISITMRTPGNDIDLAIGFLYTEGIINHPEQVKKASRPKHWNKEAADNIILIELNEDVEIDIDRLERHFYTSSSCGVCGKSSIEAIKMVRKIHLNPGPIFKTDLIHQLPEMLRQQQAIFDNTGGLHAAAIFDNTGNLSLLREDVGRHNAVDKLIGAAFQENLLPLQNHLLMLSGRVSFELVQKALMADIPILVAVGAPSSLAVELANEHGMTILGFVRDGNINIYTYPERII